MALSMLKLTDFAGEARCGKVTYGMIWRCAVRYGEERQSRHGVIWRDLVGRGRLGRPRSGEAWWGEV